MSDANIQTETEPETEDDSQIDSIPKFKRMVLRGKNYREEYEYTMFEDSMTILLMPLNDEQYTVLLEQMEEEVDDKKFAKLMKQAEGTDPEDMEDEFDAGFVSAMRTAAKLGIDPESVGLSQPEVASLVDDMIGGQSLAIGKEVMEMTSNVSKAKEFPGARGSR